MKRIITFACALLLPFMTVAAALVTLPAGVQAEDYTMIATFQEVQDGTPVEKSKTINAKVAIAGNDFYVSGLAYNFPNAYVKGTLDGNMVTFANGQEVGSDLFGTYYLCGIILQNQKIVNNDFIMSYNSETRTLVYSAQSGILVAETTKPTATTDNELRAIVTTASYTPGALSEPPVEAPVGLTTSNYLFTSTYIRYNQDENQQPVMISEPYQAPVMVGFDGDDLYIQGVSEYAPQGWVKATKNAAGKYVVPACQYMASVDLLGLGQVFRNYYITAIDRQNNMLAIEFDYDPQKDLISTTQTIAINSNKNTLQPWNYYREMTFQKTVEREATPKSPEFTFNAALSYTGISTEYTAEIFVPLLDTDGQPMMSDKLSFQFLREKNGQVEPVVFPAAKYTRLRQDVSELPYGFTDGFDFSSHTIYFDGIGVDELKTWTRLGMQSIYRGNGVEHRSDITWFDMAAFWTAGIDDIRTAGQPTANYDLQGRRVGSQARGLIISRTQRPDGTYTIRKVLKK